MEKKGKYDKWINLICLLDHLSILYSNNATTPQDLLRYLKELFRSKIKLSNISASENDDWNNFKNQFQVESFY